MARARTRVPARMSGTLRDGLAAGNSINALRLLFAAMVTVSHSVTTGGFGEEPVLGHVTLGAWAVAGFFAVSGYLITGSRLSLRAGTYLWRRIMRIYPAFLVCLLVTAGVFAPWGYWYAHGSLTGFLSTPTTPSTYVLLDLGLKMQRYDVAGGPTGVPYPATWNGSLWTLYLEFGCYLLVGVAAFAPFFRRSAGPVAALLGLVTVAALVPRGGTGIAASGGTVSALLGLLPFFLAGAVLRMSSARVRLGPAWAGTALMAVAVIAAFAPGQWFALAALPFAFLTMWAAAVLPWRRIGRRHDISYGVYIYSFPVQQSWALVGWQRHGFLAYVATVAVCVVPLAYASWLVVERPAMRWARRFGRRRVGAEAGTPTAVPVSTGV